MRNYKNSVVYAWVNSVGDVIQHSPDLNYISSLKEEMQKLANETGEYIRLVEYNPTITKIILQPPPDPEEDYYLKGGHAFGGNLFNIHDAKNYLEGVLKEFLKFPVEVFLENDCTCSIKAKNVICKISLKEDAELDLETNLYKKWKVVVSMIKGWNFNYHNKLIGNFTSALEACDNAFIAFLNFQLEEYFLDNLC